jgi:hypothetical protein
MKPNTTLLAGAAFFGGVLLSPLQAQESPGPRPGGPGGPGGLAEMLKRADTDNDGRVSKAEFLAASEKELEERFSRMDANNDGFIDEAEVREITERMRSAMQRGGGEGMRRPEGGPPGEGGFRRPEGGPPGEGMRRPEGGPPGEGGPAMAGQVFDRMDQDGDGKLSREEFEQGMGRLREMMGRGGNRGEGPGGFRGPPEGRGAPEGGFRRPPQQEGEGGRRQRPEAESDAKP